MIKNVILVALIAAASLWGMCQGYLNPLTSKRIASEVIASLSIIFGLSAAVTAIVGAKGVTTSGVTNDPALQDAVRARVERDNERVLWRLKWLHYLTLVTIILGIFFLAIYDEATVTSLPKLVSSVFVFCTIVALLFSLLLPKLLMDLVRRNSFLRKE